MLRNLIGVLFDGIAYGRGYFGTQYTRDRLIDLLEDLFLLFLGKILDTIAYLLDDLFSIFVTRTDHYDRLLLCGFAIVRCLLSTSGTRTCEPKNSDSCQHVGRIPLSIPSQNAFHNFVKPFC